jgi:hypothetical protein
MQDLITQVIQKTTNLKIQGKENQTSTLKNNAKTKITTYPK